LVCDSGDDVRRAIASRVIALAGTGERNPDVLCELALKEIREPQGYIAKELGRR
jgi:hypothetical protein